MSSLALGPVKARQRVHERGQHVGLAKERREDGIGRQRNIGLARTGQILRRASQDSERSHETEADHRHEQRGKKQHHYADGLDRRQKEGSNKSGRADCYRETLPSCDPRARAQIRPACREGVDRAPR
jgi:hypothetical protein